jgi:hypothetical protein
MKRGNVLVGVIIVALLGLAMEFAIAADGSPTDKMYAGRVYDIDYLGNRGWTQILIAPPAGTVNLAATTESSLVQAVLETALLNGMQAHVTYQDGQPAKIQTASLSTGPLGGCFEKGCVQAVSCSAATGECSARITGETQDAKTSNYRALGILLTAINKKKAVEYLTLDEQHVIMRVKVNVPYSAQPN